MLFRSPLQDSPIIAANNLKFLRSIVSPAPRGIKHTTRSGKAPTKAPTTVKTIDPLLMAEQVAHQSLGSSYSAATSLCHGFSITITRHVTCGIVAVLLFRHSDPLAHTPATFACM